MRQLLHAAALGFCLFAASLGPGAPTGTGPSPALAESDLQQSDIEERLTCQCGCGLTVATCDHLQCGFGIPAKQKIARELAAGRDGEDILADYVAEYGEKILSSPVATGFNLMAWIAPYAGLFIAGLMVFGVVWRWGRKPEDETEGGTASGGLADYELSDTDRDRLRRALEEIDE